MLRRMGRALALAALGLLGASCPERKHPERGTALVYAKADGPSPREAVERRLAHAGLKAHLFEDDTSLTVRVPEGADVGAVKQLLALPARFRLCEVDDAVAARWCTRGWPAGAQVERYADAELCRVRAPATQVLAEALAKDDGARFEAHSGEVVAHAARSECFAPRVTSGDVKEDQQFAGLPVVYLTLDGKSARELEALTRKNLKQPLLVLLDDDVLFAPVVQEAITGGKLMVTLKGAPGSRLTQQVTAIIGGPVEGLTLTTESRYGPPSLR